MKYHNVLNALIQAKGIEQACYYAAQCIYTLGAENKNIFGQRLGDKR